MTLLKMIDDYFFELLLEEDNKKGFDDEEYIRSRKENDELLNQSSALETLLKGKAVVFTKEDSSAFTTWMSNHNYQVMVEMKESYFKGMADMFALLNKMKMIKEVEDFK